MASIRDLVEAGLDEGLVKQAVDVAGFERKRGRGGLNLDAKGVAKVLKTYIALLAKLTTKAAKVNPDKFTYDDEAPAPKAKAEKKATPKAKKAKPVDDEEEDEPEADDQDDEIEEADDEEDDE
jgi:hypothetical protein